MLPSVLALLKLISYLDSPHTRQKDLPDLVTLMIRYEEDGDRRFSGAVLDASVLYDEARAYLLGRDLRALCATEDEVEVVERFLGHVCDPDFLFPLTPARRVGPR